MKKVYKWGDKIVSKCWCTVRETHQIPCACVLYKAIENGDMVNKKWLHEFWYNLEVSDQIPQELYDEDEETKLYWESLLDDVSKAAPEVRNRVMRVVYEEFHPETKGLREPTAKTIKRGKGRPKGSKNKPKTVLPSSQVTSPPAQVTSPTPHVKSPPKTTSPQVKKSGSIWSKIFRRGKGNKDKKIDVPSKQSPPRTTSPDIQIIDRPTAQARHSVHFDERQPESIGTPSEPARHSIHITSSPPRLSTRRPKRPSSHAATSSVPAQPVLGIIF